MCHAARARTYRRPLGNAEGGDEETREELVAGRSELGPGSATGLRVCGVGSLQLAGGWLVAPSRSYIHCSRVVLIALGPRVGLLTESSLIANANYASSTVTRATKAKANPISVLTGNIDGRRRQVHASASATLTWHQ